MDTSAKIRINDDIPTQSFGGLNLISHNKKFQELLKLFDEHFGSRRKRGSRYSYSDILEALAFSTFSGGTCIEDVNRNRFEMRCMPGKSQAPSADTVLRLFKELSTKDVMIKGERSGIRYKFNVNHRLNNFLCDSAVKFLGLKRGDVVNFDYDNTIIDTEKWDAKYTLKKRKGYCPGVAFINGQPCYIENRDGNAPVTFRQSQTLLRAFRRLEKRGLRVRRAVMDAGSYTTDVVDTVSKHVETFFIRAKNTEDYRRYAGEAKGGWERFRLPDGRKVDARRLDFDGLNLKDQGFEVVLYRYPDESTEKFADSLVEEAAYRTFAILTNDKTLTNREVILLYNGRGAIEQRFEHLKNDFNWKHLPTSDLRYNNAFLIITAAIYNFFRVFLIELAEKSRLRRTSEMKAFTRRFVTCPAQWVKEESGWYLDLFSPPDVLRQYVKNL